MSEMLQADLLDAQKKVQELKGRVSVLSAELERERKQNQILSSFATYFFTVVQSLDFHQGMLAEMAKEMGFLPDKPPDDVWAAVNEIIRRFQDKRHVLLQKLEEAKNKAMQFAATISMPVIMTSTDLGIKVGPQMPVGPRDKEGSSGGEDPFT